MMDKRRQSSRRSNPHACAACGLPVAPQRGRGRPRLYCCDRCRRIGTLASLLRSEVLARVAETGQPRAYHALRGLLYDLEGDVGLVGGDILRAQATAGLGPLFGPGDE